MADEQLKPGDVVRLKSGGQRMTVTEIQDNGYALCIWFDSKGESQGKAIPIVALEVEDTSTIL